MQRFLATFLHFRFALKHCAQSLKSRLRTTLSLQVRPKEWADPANLKRVCDRIKARWENRSGESLPNNEELLISDGKLEKSVIEYLLRHRDESEINLFE
jgi:hypothetical protein